MADDKKKGYPKIAPSNWFMLRDKLKQKVPAELSASYVASALAMAEGSARSNVVAPLKALGLISDEGKPTELAYDWRDDSKYPEVCERIIEATYPQELKDLYDSPNTTLEQLVAWFMRDAKCGEPAAKMYGSTYLMLLKKTPIVTKDVQKNTSSSLKKPETKAKVKKKAEKLKQTSQDKEQGGTSEKSESDFSPRLHIDVQVHISPESSPEQIDKIFEAMAKHLKGFRS